MPPLRDYEFNRSQKIVSGYGTVVIVVVMVACPPLDAIISIALLFCLIWWLAGHIYEWLDQAKNIAVRIEEDIFRFVSQINVKDKIGEILLFIINKIKHSSFHRTILFVSIFVAILAISVRAIIFKLVEIYDGVVTSAWYHDPDSPESRMIWLTSIVAIYVFTFAGYFYNRYCCWKIYQGTRSHSSNNSDGGYQRRYDFGFNQDQFQRKPYSDTSNRPMPYGVDKRHPEDVKLWAYVDDPNASDGERRNALDQILRARARREGQRT